MAFLTLTFVAGLLQIRPAEAPGPCPTGPTGISSCAGQADGDYQYCSSCNSFAKCTYQAMQLVPCTSGTVWDDTKKLCDYTSTTCTLPTFALPTVRSYTTTTQSMSTTTEETTSRESTSGAGTSSTHAVTIDKTTKNLQTTTTGRSLDETIVSTVRLGDDVSSKSTMETTFQVEKSTEVIYSSTTQVVAGLNAISDLLSGTMNATESSDSNATKNSAVTVVQSNDTFDNTAASNLNTWSHHPENLNKNSTSRQSVITETTKIDQTTPANIIIPSPTEGDTSASFSTETLNTSLFQVCTELLGHRLINTTSSEVTSTSAKPSSSTRFRPIPAMFDDRRSSSNSDAFKIVTPVFTDSDRRPSHIAIGTVGAGCVVTPFVIFLVVDLPKLFSHSKIMLRNLGILRRNTVRPL